MNKTQRYANHPLNEEIERLYTRKTELEDRLAENWEHLQNNYPTIIIRSVFRKAGIGPSIIKAFVNLSRIQEVIGKLTVKAISWIGSIVNNWFIKTAE